MVTLKDDNYCFVCGKGNPKGLQVSFSLARDGRSLRGTFTPRREHEGWQGIVHGGIISALMDEAMVKLSAMLGMPAVSAEIAVRFKAPAAAGDELIVTASIGRETRRIVEARATVERGHVVIGEATGKLMRTTKEHRSG